MRFVHTSDWHAGRHWKGLNRLDELAAVLEHLGDFVEREKIDALLMSGDVFDHTAPSADAESAVFRFFKRIGRAGTASVVIAGNHDHPLRLEAWGSLAELVLVTAVGRPKRAEAGGLVEVRTPSGEMLRVAALPFAPPRQLISGLELAHDETEAHLRYAEHTRRAIEQLCAAFSPDAVNVLMAHAHIHGALLAGTERAVHIGEHWATTAEALPSSADYVALGHIHRPQQLLGAPAPAFYAGSPMQLDFGEEGEDKSFLVVEAHPGGQPATVDRVAYRGARRLRSVRASLGELERDADRLRSEGWLRVVVPLAAPEGDIALRVRKLLPNAVSVDVELPVVHATPLNLPVQGLPAVEQYRLYFEQTFGRAPQDALLDAFNALNEAAAD